MEVGDDVAGVSYGLADRREPVDDLGGAGRGVDGLQRGGGVHLHGGESGLGLSLGQFGRVPGHVAADPRVNPDAVPDRAAEQLVYRRAVCLARDVPQRLVDAGDRAGQDGAAAVEAALGQYLPVVLDAQRVHADEVVR